MLLPLTNGSIKVKGLNLTVSDISALIFTILAIIKLYAVASFLTLWQFVEELWDANLKCDLVQFRDPGDSCGAHLEIFTKIVSHIGKEYRPIFLDACLFLQNFLLGHKRCKILFHFCCAFSCRIKRIGESGALWRATWSFARVNPVGFVSPKCLCLSAGN